MRLIRTASSPSLISISAMPDSSSSSMSFLIFRMSMPGVPPEGSESEQCLRSGRASQPQRGGPYRRLIAESAQPADDAHSDVGDIGMAPEGLACVSVGQVHLDEGQAGAKQRIAQRDARMREGARVHDEEGN